MKRTGLKNRGKGLERGTRLKAKRDTPRRSERVLNDAYLAVVRTLPCYVCARQAPSDPDHQGEHPYGRKADDDTSVPMCRDCHTRRTDGFIAIAGCEMRPTWFRVNKVRMREWCDAAIAVTRALVLPRLGCANPGDVPY